MKLPAKRTSLLKKASGTAVLSFLAAVLAWFVVINTGPDQERVVTVKNVPVTTSTTALTSLGLNIIEGADPRVSVQVKGRVIEVGNLVPEDIQVTASFADIAGAGTYDLKLYATTSNGTVVGISPETITMTFDRELNRELPVTVDINGLSVPENDYILGSVAATPATIMVRGPERELNRISRAVVHAELEEPLTRSQVISSAITLLDSDENPITSDHVTTDFSEADITIPVKRKVELPLRLSFINVPDGFPLEGEEGLLEFDGVSVETGPMDENGLTPASAVPALLEAARSGYITACALEEDGAVLRVDCGDPAGSPGTGTETVLWFDAATHALTRGEISSDGFRVILCEFSDFTGN